MTAELSVAIIFAWERAICVLTHGCFLQGLLYYACFVPLCSVFNVKQDLVPLPYTSKVVVPQKGKKPCFYRVR